MVNTGDRDNRYMRSRAVDYALSYGKSPNPAYRYLKSHGDGGGDCSNFISQCLFAGGASMDYNSKWQWWYRGSGNSITSDDRWSVSWAVAHSLYWTLKSRGKANAYGLKGVEVDNMDMLELGDIIQYENKNGVIYHSAIITGFRNILGFKEPLITQHTFDAVNIHYFKPAAAKMHFMKIVV